MVKSDQENAYDPNLPLPMLIAQLHSALSTQARMIISRHGMLTLAQWRVIRLISLGRQNTSTALRKLAGIDKSQFSKEVGQLVSLGLVELAPYNRDRRQQVLNLTKHGQEQLDRLRPILDARQAHLRDAIGPDQLDKFRNAIGALIVAAQKADFEITPPIQEDA